MKNHFIAALSSHEAHGSRCRYVDRTVCNVIHLFLPLIGYIVCFHGTVIFQIGTDLAAVSVVTQHVRINLVARGNNRLRFCQRLLDLFLFQTRTRLNADTDRTGIIRCHQLRLHSARQNYRQYKYQNRKSHNHRLVV